MASTPRTPAPERPPPPVPTSAPPPPLETPRSPPMPVPTPPPPLETPRSPPSPSSSQPGDEYHTPAPSLADGSPREEAGSGSFPSSDGSGREGAGAPPKSPQLSPVRLAAPRLFLPPPPPSPRATGRNVQEEEEEGGAAKAAPAREPLRLATKGLTRSTSSQRSLATTNCSASPSPSPTPPSPLTPATPAPVVNSNISGNGNNNRSGQSTPKRAAETKLPLSSLPAATATTIAVPSFDPVEEAVTSPLRLGGKAPRLDHHQHQDQHAAAAVENGGSVPPDVAAVAAVGERRELSVTLRLATAVLSLAAFSVIASARTSGWAGDYYARHLQYRYAVAVNVIVCAYSIAQSFGEIRRLISPRFIFRSMSSYYCSLFLDQALAYLLMSASSAAASRNDLWVARFGTDAFNRKITSALWLSFIAFLMLALNALISTANLFSMV